MIYKFINYRPKVNVGSKLNYIILTACSPITYDKYARLMAGQ
jgi:hypothetical protein